MLVIDVVTCLEAAAILASGVAASMLVASHRGAAPGIEDVLQSDFFVALSACLSAQFVLPSLRGILGFRANANHPARPTSPTMRLRSWGGAFIGTALAIAALCTGWGMFAASFMTAALTMPTGIALWLAIAFISVAVLRLSAIALIAWLERHGLTSETIVIIGPDDMAARVARALTAQRVPMQSVHIIAESAVSRDMSMAMPIMTRRLASAALSHAPDRVIIAMDGTASAATTELLRTLRCHDLQVDMALPHISGLCPPAADALGNDVFLLCLARRSFEGWALAIKVAADKVLAATLLVFVAPVMLLAALAIRIDTPGPVIFRQTRHGWNNTPFEILKFRTMLWQGRGVADGSRQTTRTDGRVTRVGRWLRHTSIDELPQLLNVLRGEMSLVGPRPLPVAMRTNGRLGEEIVPEYLHRHRAPPGITGLAQVRGCRGAIETDEQLRQRVAADLSYVDRWSILLDVRILLETPLKLLIWRKNAF